MKIYNYNQVTKEFFGESVADADPLNEGGWLIPANATTIKPPVTNQHEASIFDGVSWVISSDYRGAIYYRADGTKITIEEIGKSPTDDPEYYGDDAPPPSLAELKSLKNAEINAARLSANQTTFSYQGKQVACDPLSRSDIDGINGYVATRGEMPGSWIGGWKATDNSIILIPDVPTWNAFYDSMIAQGQANFLKSQNLKAQLAVATTSEQIEAIVW